jgi:hypothetical protein
MCLQEKERLEHENKEIANFVTHNVKRRQDKKDKLKVMTMWNGRRKEKCHKRDLNM